MPEVFMPRLSDTMEEGAINSWRKQVGQEVHKGDVLAEIETDKAVMELEAYDQGVLTEILVEAGSSAPIGAPIAVIGGPEQAPAAPPTPQPETAPTPQPPQAPQPPAETSATQHDLPAPPPASPLARTLAKQHGVDLTQINGTGPGGRILRADIEAAATRRTQPAAPTPPPAQTPPTALAGESRALQPASTGSATDDEEMPLSRVRRLTAERLTGSATQSPHFHLTRTLEADALLAFRTQANADLEDADVRISITDLLVKACAHALRRHPQVNSSWAETKLLRHRHVNIGIAVAIEDGLVVPVVHDADRKPLTEISHEVHDLAERARARRLTLDEITGGTFTISNLGMYGIERFTAVINPPDAAILAVGAARPTPVARAGQVTLATTITLTLGIDHRVLDGATAAVFLGELTGLLEHPARIVL